MNHSWAWVPMGLMPKGVDRDLFNPRRRNDGYWEQYSLSGEFTYIYVGRVSREKNLEVLFQAFILLAQWEKNINLVIVGNGPSLEEYKMKYGGREDIVFTGYLTGEDLAGAYASADVFVFPSLTDTFGNVVLEANASGIPVIVSTEGGPAEVIRSCRSGLAVNVNNIEDLAEAMKSLRHDRELYDLLRKGALEKAEMSSWETALKAI